MCWPSLVFDSNDEGSDDGRCCCSFGGALEGALLCGDVTGDAEGYSITWYFPVHQCTGFRELYFTILETPGRAI